MGNFDVIHDSPSKIYHSILPFCPSSSWLRTCYSGELLQAVKVVRGIPAEWGTCFRTVGLAACPTAYSYKNNIIVVGLKSGNIITLDATTGSQTAVLCKESKEVACLVFSSDGKLLVSGGTTIRLWDVQTGGIIRTFNSHNYPSCLVSISADCTRVASASYYTIHLWDIQTGAGGFLSPTIWHHFEHINFSPINPRHLMAVHDG